MMKNNMDRTHPTVKRIHWYILILTLAFLGLALFVLITLGGGLTKVQDFGTLKESIFDTKKETLTLKIKEDTRSYSVGQPINILVLADSQNQDIVAFDLLLTYDKESFNVPVATTKLSGYTVVPFDRDAHLSITAVQRPGFKERSIFKSTEILNLTFNPKKVGKFEFAIIPKTLDETTKFVTVESKKILFQKASTLSIEVN